MGAAMTTTGVSGVVAIDGQTAAVLILPGVPGYSSQDYPMSAATVAKMLRAKGVTTAYLEQGARTEIDLKSDEVWLPFLVVKDIGVGVVASGIIEALKWFLKDGRDSRVHARIAKVTGPKGSYVGLQIDGPAEQVIDVIQKFLDGDD